MSVSVDAIKLAPSVTPKPIMTEEVREALMRLSMCAREECSICKHVSDCGFDKQVEIATENMNTILNALALDEFKKDYDDVFDLMTAIEELPSVTPTERTGEWKEIYAETDYRNGWIEFTCENCEYQHGLESGEYGWSYGEPIPWKYCPLCGEKMGRMDNE